MSEPQSFPFDLPEPFAATIVVKDEHVDRLDHTNNTVYLQWCEDVAWRHADSVGMGWPEWERLDRAMAVHAMRVSFVRPSFLGDAVEIATWIVRSDDKLRVSRYFQAGSIRDGRPETLIRAEIDYVCIQISNGRPRRLPDAFRTAFPILEPVRRAYDELEAGLRPGTTP